MFDRARTGASALGGSPVVESQQGRQPPEGAEEIDLRPFLRPIEALLERVKRTDYRNFETLADDRAWQGVVARVSLPNISRLVGEARHLVEEIVTACVVEEAEPVTGEVPTVAGTPWLEDDMEAPHKAERARPGASAQPATVEDVAFFVLLELRQRAERLARIGPTSDPLAIIGECDGALRRIHRGLGAIAIAIARAERIPVRVADASTELKDSLLTRAAYARFRARLLVLAETGAATLDVRLRAAAGQISVLVGGGTAPVLRVRDLLQLQDLQRRILAWTTAHTDEIAGTRLWQDILAFVEMLARVNRRQELVEHDARVVGALVARLRGEGRAVDDECAGLIRTLVGLDDELDRIAAAGPAPSARALRAIVERLARQFGLTPEGAP